MVNLRKFQLSCKYLWGYNTLIDLDEIDSLDEAIQKVLSRCQHFLENNNLLELVDYLKSIKNKFHIHDMTFEDILLSNINNVVYICHH